MTIYTYIYNIYVTPSPETHILYDFAISRSTTLFRAAFVVDAKHPRRGPHFA